MSRADLNGGGKILPGGVMAPIGELIAEITGTHTPRWMSNRSVQVEMLMRSKPASFGPGFTYVGPKGECWVRFTGQGRYFVDWLDENGEAREACFEQRVERIS